MFVNANCTFLDGGMITIGAHTLIGPCVQIYTPQHPMDYKERREPKETAYPVTIGEELLDWRWSCHLSGSDYWRSLCYWCGQCGDEEYSR